MAGIYVHIPFCKTRCLYCGFYSTTRHEWRQRYVDAICKEWQLRRNNIDVPVRTIYIGGGTPSQLMPDELEQLFHAIGSAEEVTIECNPDDVTPSFASLLSQLPVNRVSMGAQTFGDERLKFIGRRHNSSQIQVAVERLRDVGIGNISIDLMYGFPNETLAEWHYDIDCVLALGVEHLSAYALMFEEGTPLYRLLEQGRVKEIDEELSRQMYYELIDRLVAAGYEHYEISNFAKRGFRSVHNSNYWNQTPYIGLGAAAHSFDGKRRQWNVDDVEQYIEGVESGLLHYDYEDLDDDAHYNDVVMTALRTCEGLDLSLLSDTQRDYCIHQAHRYIDDDLLIQEKDHLRLSRRGLFVSDMIMCDLMRA